MNAKRPPGTENRFAPLFGYIGLLRAREPISPLSFD